MSLPRSWEDDEWVETDLDGTAVRFRGVGFEEYQDALNDAVREGATGARQFLALLEDRHGAETEVVG